MSKNKLAIIEVKITLPAGFKPRALTYRAFSNFEKTSEQSYILNRAKELFTKHVLKSIAEYGLTEADIKVKTSMKIHHVHLFVLPENEVHIKLK